MKTSVGFLAMTEVNGTLYAILQRRGEWNHEKMAPESWPGACQVTAHGKIELGEEFLPAVKREVAEELGSWFGEIVAGLNWFRAGNPQGGDIDVVTLYEDDKVRTEGFIIDNSYLRGFRLQPSTGGLKLITKEEVMGIVDLTSSSYNKEVGVVTRSIVAMFPDEIKAVKKAFEVFGKK